MFWRIYYGFLRLTGLAQCFAGGYPCCCTTSGSTSSKPPPPGSTSSPPPKKKWTSSNSVPCIGCPGSFAPRRIAARIATIGNRSCKSCADLLGTYVLDFSAADSTGYNCSWEVRFDPVCSCLSPAGDGNNVAHIVGLRFDVARNILPNPDTFITSLVFLRDDESGVEPIGYALDDFSILSSCDGLEDAHCTGGFIDNPYPCCQYSFKDAYLTALE